MASVLSLNGPVKRKRGFSRTTRAPPPRRTGGRRCHAGRADLALTAIQNPHFFRRLPSGGEKAGGKKLFHKGPDQQQRPGLRHAGASHTEGFAMDVYSIIIERTNREAGRGEKADARGLLADFTSMAAN